MTKIDKSRIAIALRTKYDENAYSGGVKISLICSIVSAIIGGILLLMAFLTENSRLTGVTGISIAGVVFAGTIVFLILAPVSYIKNKTAKKWVPIILEDAVELQAKVTLHKEIVRANPYGTGSSSYKIKVEFEYEGELRTKISSKGAYKKYIDEILPIAYSPKYDEVFILKGHN